MFTNAEIQLVVFSDEITSIGKEAFAGSWIHNVYFSNNSQLTNLSEKAFYDCDSLTNITLPKSLHMIGAYTFSDCDGLTDFVLQDGDVTIGDHSFAECKKLSNVTFNNSVRKIQKKAFYKCTALKEVNLSKATRLKEIEDMAFYNCDSVTSVVLPKADVKIGCGSFSSCKNLRKIKNLSKKGSFEYNSFSELSSVKVCCVQNSVADRYFRSKRYKVYYSESKLS